MGASRFVIAIAAYSVTAATSDGGIDFRVVPSRKPPFIRTSISGYRLSDDHPPDPAEVAVKVTAHGAKRLLRTAWNIEIDPGALPNGVQWIESQGSAAEKYHYFQITRSKPFRLRREDFRGLPDWLRLPKLLLKPRETPNQTMQRTAGRSTF
jgi:hypothetical protein